MTLWYYLQLSQIITYQKTLTCVMLLLKVGVNTVNTVNSQSSHLKSSERQ